MELKRYFPCPACHDIGGGGYVQKWTLEDSISYYVCEECNLAWHNLEEAAWESADIIYNLAENDNFSPEAVDLRSNRHDIELFIIPDDLLKEHIDETLQKGNLIGSADARIVYRQLQFSSVIGCRGEKVLIVGENSQNLIAFPSKHLVKDDFHW